MRRVALLTCFLLVSLAACGDATPLIAGHDAGTTSDAGPTSGDAGTPDAGSPDAGAPGDDAGTPPTDAGCTFDDPLDDLGFDQNCDGAEGVLTQAVYVANDGDDIYGGSPQYPVKTLARALALYRLDRARRAVLVATSGAAYSADGLAGLLTEGAVVTGGLSRASGWSRPQGTATAPELTTIEAPGSGVVAEVQNAGTSLSYVALHSIADGGLDTFGLVLSGQVALQLRHAHIEVDGAGDGVAGEGGVDAGDNSVAFKGGDAQFNAVDPTGAAGTGTCGAAPAFAGGRGGAPAFASPQAGAPGEADVDAGQPVASGGAKGTGFAAGGPGDDGAAGADGDAGVAASEAWSFVDGGVVVGVPTAATDGRLGGGGGGGGGALTSSTTAGGGGGGGAGGCPGSAGLPGTRGGFSLGLVVTGQWPTLDDVRVTAGAGGRGGVGGEGGLGGAGGEGGAGTGAGNIMEHGGHGGAGGPGGAGGRGAAGNGGWSVGVLTVGSPVPDPLTGVTIVPGAAGTAGDANAHDGQSLATRSE